MNFIKHSKWAFRRFAFYKPVKIGVGLNFYLEGKSRGDLHDSRIACASDLAKQAGIDTTAWVSELRMIEDIERSESQLELLGLSESDVFQQRHVPVIQTGAVEKAPGRISDLPERFAPGDRRSDQTHNQGDPAELP
jgi:hypothetical protein